MRLCIQEPQAYERTRQAEERFLELREPIQAPAQPTEAVQPGDGPLHEPAEHAQPAAVLPAALGQDRDDPQPAEQLPHWLGVVPPVALQPLRLPALGTRLAAD